ncbi:MAG: c-type cytochrome [Blastocatellia bacterium]|nr:c-type cytochrome [Blastocatellia bacterium]MBN8724251.1 c-type cytochrome [Acidobacteriota bacterium]
MKKVKIFALLAFVFMLSLTLISPVMGQKKSTKKSSGSANVGAKIFKTECTTCHAGGKNVVEAEKTLELATLKKFGFNGPEDIKKRISEGAGVMPAYKDSLKPAEIDAVANYVWAQAQKGWK